MFHVIGDKARAIQFADLMADAIRFPLSTEVLLGNDTENIGQTPTASYMGAHAIREQMVAELREALGSRENPLIEQLLTNLRQLVNELSV